MKTKLVLYLALLFTVLAYPQQEISIVGDSELFMLRDTQDVNDYGTTEPAANIKAFADYRGRIRIRIASFNETGTPFGSPNGYFYTDFVDDTDTPFASIQAVLDWFRDNTGKSKASGGNGGSAAPTTIDFNSSRNIGSGDVGNELYCTTSSTLTITEDFTEMPIDSSIVLLVKGAILTVQAASNVTLADADAGTEIIGNGSGQASGVLKKVGTNEYVLFQ